MKIHYFCLFYLSGGIGGGGLNLPILLVVFKYRLILNKLFVIWWSINLWFESVSRSVTLSLCAVFGSTICQFMLNYKSSHPSQSTRPLIYYDCVWILLPAQVSQSFHGHVSYALAAKLWHSSKPYLSYFKYQAHYSELKCNFSNTHRYVGA